MGIMLRNGVLALALVTCAHTQPRTELRFAVHADPKTFDPLLATEEVSEMIRYLTGGVLIRFNRHSQQLEPELATSWKVCDEGKRIDFVLRRNVSFSDGTPFSAADVVATMRRIMTAGLPSAIADLFRSAGGHIRAQANGPDEVSIFFSTPVAGLELLFDQLAISSARPVPAQTAVLGPFMLQEHKTGQYVLLKRNPHYWKSAPGGEKLPYLTSVRLDILENRETELLRFRRGELDFVDKLEPEAFERLNKNPHSGALNLGPSLDSEFLWFNQNPNAPLSVYKKNWFQSRLFRQAISTATNRDDIVRLVYRGYADPAAGFVSPANKFWFDSKLNPPTHDPQLALKLLEEDGFRFDGHVLHDRDGNAVEFSLITNAGSRTRAQIGMILQQDLMKIGIRLNFLPIEFQSLIERITKTARYEACLLGLTNVEIDPNAQMNVWLSSGTHHAWNPAQAKPATAWEAEIDRLAEVQHNTSGAAARKRAFDCIQEILAEEAPIIFLVHPDVLLALSSSLRNVMPSPLPPHLYWNIEHLRLAAANQGGRTN
jgi:peptide/nickel transport system substrate-binding protein